MIPALETLSPGPTESFIAKRSEAPMALRTTAQSREAGRAPLPLNSRRDTWWLRPLLTVIVLGSFVVYATWRGLENQFYEVGPYLSPFYSPLLPINLSIGGWNISPAIYIIAF